MITEWIAIVGTAAATFASVLGVLLASHAARQARERRVLEAEERQTEEWEAEAASGAAPGVDSGNRSSGDPVRVLLVDDHDVVREGVAALLESDASIKVVGTAADGTEAITSAERLIPDVILMDVRMPRLNGVKATAEIKLRVPSTKIVMLTSYTDEAAMYDSLSAGADGFVIKDIRGMDLIGLVQEVAGGKHPIDARMAGHLLNEFDAPVDWPSGMKSPRLTAIESQVLALLAENAPLPTIAATVDLPVRVASAAVANAFRKVQLQRMIEVRARDSDPGIVFVDFPEVRTSTEGVLGS